jgi:SAM-dependent methyltransferase
MPPRFDAECPSCRSLERHRHQYLWIKPHESALRGKRILHFAPEPVMRKIYSSLAASYLSADIAGYADRILNIEAIDMPDESWDVVVANHVLEHVDDRKALAEIRRILSPGGLAIVSFPLALTFEQTYENPAVTARADRDLHFGQWDHIRYYGADAAEAHRGPRVSRSRPSPRPSRMCIVTRRRAAAASSSRTNASGQASNQALSGWRQYIPFCRFSMR